MPPAALSRSRAGLAAHWPPWKRLGMADDMAFGLEPVPYGSGMANAPQQSAPDVAAAPLDGRPQSRAGTSYRLPLGQSWVAVWRPLPLQFRIVFYQHRNKRLSTSQKVRHIVTHSSGHNDPITWPEKTASFCNVAIPLSTLTVSGQICRSKFERY